MIYQCIHNLILSVIKWEILAATICPLTDSMLCIEYFSMSFRGTTEGIGGKAISLAAFLSFRWNFFEILDFVVKVKLLLSLTLTFVNKTDLPSCRTFNLLVSYNVHFAIMDESATPKTANFFSSPLGIYVRLLPRYSTNFHINWCTVWSIFFGLNKLSSVGIWNKILDISELYNFRLCNLTFLKWIM